VLEREAASAAPAASSSSEIVKLHQTTDARPSSSEWESRLELERHRAETERLRVLVDFLARPIHAHGGSEPDPDIITAYNLAVEAALNGIRRAASAG
jgi:hypothetical protein